MNPRRYLRSVLRAQRLTDQERDGIRARLVTFLHERPLPHDSERLIVFPSYFLHISRTVVSISVGALVLLIGSGISYAAERSLPGDPLYTVKTNVNEQVRAALAISANARAQWEIERVERRLEETEELIAVGKLNAKTSTAIATQFEQHSERIRQNIEVLAKKQDVSEAASLNSDFSATLRAHHRILGLLAIEPATETTVRPLLSTVEDRSNSRQDTQTSLEARVSAQAQTEAKTSAEGKKRSANNKITEVKSLYNKTKKSLTPEVQVKIESGLAAASKSYENAQARIGTNSYGEAFTLFQQAHRSAQEAKLLIKSRKHLALGIQQDMNARASQASGAATATSTVEVNTRDGDTSSTDDGMDDEDEKRNSNQK